LIAQGRFTDAYMVNRHSNVFPASSGAVRPAVRARLPPRPHRGAKAGGDLPPEARRRRPPRRGRGPAAEDPEGEDGKRIACIGAGCASLTWANDLMPLGYQVTIFEQYGEPGGLMPHQHSLVRLPHTVLNEEIAMITGMGVELKLNSPVGSLRQLLKDGGFDAVFVGSGARRQGA